MEIKVTGTNAAETMTKVKVWLCLANLEAELHNLDGLHVPLCKLMLMTATTLGLL